MTKKGGEDKSDAFDHIENVYRAIYMCQRDGAIENAAKYLVGDMQHRVAIFKIR